MTDIKPVYSQKAPLFTLRTKLDTFYFLYCILHLVITILIDSCLVIPIEYQPSFQRSIIEFHISQNNDFLLLNPPNWLIVFGWVEIICQLPFFAVGAYNLLKRKSKVYPWLFIYGVEASLTTLCCLVYILLKSEENGLNVKEMWNLWFVYLPTFIIPSFLSLDMLFNRIWYDQEVVQEKKER